MKIGHRDNGSVGIRGAVALQLGSKYANVFVSLVITMVLARILAPEEYGLLAVVSIFTTFFSTLADVGIGPAIIQYDDLTEEDYSALLLFCAAVGLGLALVFVILSWPISWFYGEERLVGLCLFASLSVFFNAANMVPNGILLKRKMFLTIGACLVVATTCGGILAIALALAGFGAYALVANVVISSAVIYFWNLIASGAKFGNRHFMAPLKRVFRYSAFQAGFSTVNYFSRNLDNILIGKVASVTNLGFYDKAYKLTTYPITALSGVIGSVLQPYIAPHKHDNAALFSRWCRVSKAISLVAAPTAAIMFCGTSEIVTIVYGSQWGESVPLLQALSVSVYFQMVNNPSGAFFQGSGHTDYMFMHSLLATGITVVLLVVGLATDGVLGGARGVSAAYCLHTFSILYFLGVRSLEAKPIRYLEFFLPEICTAIGSCIICSMLAPIMPTESILGLVCKSMIIFAIFALSYLATGQIKYLHDSIGIKRRR